MTEIVPFHPPAPSGTSLELAPEAWKLACRVAGTEFVPKGLRGKPEAVLACILAGHEAGLSPMTSLRQIYVVEGRPAMAAELMRALVLRAGHELWTEESSSSRAIVCGQRAGSAREFRVAWTIDDAKRANLLGKDNWKKYPRAMLLARATTELCRMIFPDVLAGISHSIEEIADGGVEDVGPLEHLGAPEVEEPSGDTAPPQTARARRPATSPATAQETTVETVSPPNRGEVPDLPGEDHREPQDDESDIVDAEIVEPADEGIPLTPEEAQEEADQQDGEYVPPPDETDWDDGSDEYPPDDDPPPPEQSRPLSGPAMIATKLNNRGIRDRAKKLAVVAEIVGHPVETTNDLTPDETSAVIRYLDELPDDAVLLAGDDEPAPSTPARTTAVTPPEEWTGDRWREFLRQRRMKVAPVLKAAQQIGADQDPPVSVGTLDDLPGSGICSELVGWIEDNAS